MTDKIKELEERIAKLEKALEDHKQADREYAEAQEESAIAAANRREYAQRVRDQEAQHRQWALEEEIRRASRR